MHFYSQSTPEVVFPSNLPLLWRYCIMSLVFSTLCWAFHQPAFIFCIPPLQPTHIFWRSFPGLPSCQWYCLSCKMKWTFQKARWSSFHTNGFDSSGFLWAMIPLTIRRLSEAMTQIKCWHSFGLFRTLMMAKFLVVIFIVETKISSWCSMIN